MALAFTTVATAIAGLSVSGVTIKDLTAVPEAVDVRECPVVYPHLEDYLTDFSVGKGGEGRDSYGTDAQAFKIVRYTLNYVYAHSAVGSERGLYKIAQDMVSKLGLFLDALIADSDLNGAIDNVPTSFSLGIVTDNAGNEFHGCIVPIRVIEYVNG